MDMLKSIGKWRKIRAAMSKILGFNNIIPKSEVIGNRKK